MIDFYPQKRSHKFRKMNSDLNYTVCINQTQQFIIQNSMKNILNYKQKSCILHKH